MTNQWNGLLSSRRSTAAPKYRLIADDLLDKIRSGELKPGQRLPPERELEKTYHVSRITIRAALDALAERGVLSRKQGSGTTIARPRIYRPLDSLRPIAEDLEYFGLDVAVEPASVVQVPASPPVAHALEMAAGTPVCRITHCRVASGEPLAVFVISYPLWVTRRVSEEDLHDHGLLRRLDAKYGLPRLESHFKLAAAPAPADTARMLGISTGDPLLVCERVVYTEGGRPLHYSQMSYRGDRVGYSARVLHRLADSSPQQILTHFEEVDR